MDALLHVYVLKLYIGQMFLSRNKRLDCNEGLYPRLCANKIHYSLSYHNLFKWCECITYSCKPMCKTCITSSECKIDKPGIILFYDLLTDVHVHGVIQGCATP